MQNTLNPQSVSKNCESCVDKVFYVQDKFVKLIKISENDFMENEEAEFKALFTKYLAWKDCQKSQTDGYEYERSFVEFTRIYV